ncbi:hypothetical protein [Halobacterium wangiae]|uniref:hypothetical protein n=1 Tax=Halobacterium wangiae TaxID=2902623 RepID=UPI001E466763|nr:hypothetical protein [Halobacterium wangiae]
MRLVLRLVDRTLALSLAFAPLVQLLSRSTLGPSVAVLAGGLLSLLVAALVVHYSPDCRSGDAWRFGGYTFVGLLAVSLVARHGASFELGDALALGVLAWLVVAAGARWLVGRRRAGTSA